MNMRWLVAGAVAAVATVGAGSLAGAAPTKNIETYICDGVSTDFAVAGRSGFLNGEHYLAHNLVVVGTFDPTGPAPAVETFRDEQWTSGRTDGLDCRAQFSEAVEGGVETITITLNAIPTCGFREW